MSVSTSQKIQPLVKYQVDLIIPCYNPVQGWEVKFAQTINQLSAHLSQCDVHLILVDDCSTDNFFEMQDAYLKRNLNHVTIIHNKENSGKGKSIKNGLLHSKSSYVIYTDADLPYDFESVGRVVDRLINGTDIVFGTRSQEYYAKLPFQRKVISKVLQFFNRNILGLKVSDTQCGLKGLNVRGKYCLESTKSNSYLFDLELLMVANEKSRLKVETVLAEISPNFEISNMKVRILVKEALSLFKILFKR
jgi:glycosyltransferase involved in cell wall biosynthesis